MGNFNQFRSDYERQLGEALQRIDPEQVSQAKELIEGCEGTIWLIGNGGLASLAEHMAVDLQLAGKRAQALTQSAAVTTWGNDIAFEDIFTAQLRRLAKQGDLLIAISGGGGSYNITHALCWARDRRIRSIFIGGVGKITDLHDKRWVEGVRFTGQVVALPVKHVGLAQDLTQIILHEITYSMMEGK